MLDWVLVFFLLLHPYYHPLLFCWSYDVWAIRYGYSQFQDNEEENLLRILNESTKKEHAFGNDANVFTPNNDGKNDLYKIHGNGIKDFYMVIYDRWGEPVFETYDINLSWDGTIKGKRSNNESFGYYLKVTYLNLNEEINTGNITILN